MAGSVTLEQSAQDVCTLSAILYHRHMSPDKRYGPIHGLTGQVCIGQKGAAGTGLVRIANQILLEGMRNIGTRLGSQRVP